MVSEKQLEELGVVNWSVLAKDFGGADLLLGNGFSLTITGHFDYDSLFQEFLRNCSPAGRNTFRKFGTSSFELILEKLRNARDVNQILKIETLNQIDGAIERLKTGLVTAIQANHPRSDTTDWEQLKRIASQLSTFKDIYTLNYDLFLYHIIMQMKDEAAGQKIDMPYSDYFWGGDPEDQYKYFVDYDEYHDKHVYYLHGALFLFKIPPDTFKLKRGTEPKELVSMIGDVINNGRMPLFVSEGGSKEKLKAIERSNYLNFCYGRLEISENNLVIFGSSLSRQDTHIANAINYKKKNKRELAIAIHIGNKSKDDLEKEIKRLKAKFKSHKIYFFDSKTIFKF